MEISGKMVVITGASTGIGKATAQALLARWAKVIVLGQHKPGYEVDFIETDVSNEASIQTALKKIDYVDILVNNAGIAKVAPLQATSTEMMDEILNTNFKGQFRMCKYVSQKMTAGSCIINIASIAGLKSFPEWGMYCVSKAAVISMTKTLALELASKNIRVNAIAPGIIDTPIFSKIYGEEAAKDMMKAPESFGPLKRAWQPEEIAHAVWFLIENENTTGSVVVVDGGEMAE